MIKYKHLKEDSSSTEHGSDSGIFLSNKHVQLLYDNCLKMKISLNTRRTSPPLNMAQNSQSNRNLEFYVSI